MEGNNLKSLDKFNQDIEELKYRRFLPVGINEKIKSAINTPASLFELHTCAKTLIHNSNLDINSIQKWIPTLDVDNSFENYNVDVEKLTVHQQMNAKTNISVWYLINALTHFATHDNNIEIKNENRMRIQMEASRFLSKKFDTDSLINGPFDKKETILK